MASYLLLSFLCLAGVSHASLRGANLYDGQWPSVESAVVPAAMSPEPARALGIGSLSPSPAHESLLVNAARFLGDDSVLGNPLSPVQPSQSPSTLAHTSSSGSLSDAPSAVQQDTPFDPAGGVSRQRLALVAQESIVSPGQSPQQKNGEDGSSSSTELPPREDPQAGHGNLALAAACVGAAAAAGVLAYKRWVASRGGPADYRAAWRSAFSGGTQRPSQPSSGPRILPSLYGRATTREPEYQAL